MSETTKCPDCAGTGWDCDKPCRPCNGTGKRASTTKCPKCGANAYRSGFNDGLPWTIYVCGCSTLYPSDTLDCVRNRLAASEQAREKAERERDEYFHEAEDLQCGIASAFGWNLEGEPFLNAVKRVIRERDEAQAACVEMRQRLWILFQAAEGGAVLGHTDIRPILDSDNPGAALLARLRAAEEIVAKHNALMTALAPVMGEEIPSQEEWRDAHAKYEAAKAK